MTGKTQTPQGWREVRLGDMADVLDARRIPLNAEDRSKMPGEYPYYGANGVIDFIDRWIFDEDDDLVLLAEDGGHFDEFRNRPIAFRVEGKCWVNNHAHVLKATTCTVGGFLFHSLVNKDIRLYINGTTRSKLTQADLLQVEVSLPPLPVQRAIVAVLDSIDDAIDHTDAVIVSSEQLRDSLLHQLLTRGVPGWHTAWNNVPGLGMMPADWEVVSLGDVVEVLDSKRIPLNADDRANMSRFYPYYGANGIVDYVDHWIFDEKQDLILLAEDGGHFDEFATRPIAYRVRGKCWVNNHAHVLKSKDVGMSSFIFHSIVNKDIRPFINGTTRSKLTQADLREVPIGVPPVTEQLVVSGVLDEVDMTLEQVRRERERLQVLKESTADTLLTGRTRTVH